MSPSRKRWCFAVATPLIALGGCSARSQEERIPPPPTVAVVESRVMDVPVVADSNGTTRALNRVSIRARVKGFLKEQHFQEGMNVKQGDLLFVIDEEPFMVQREQAMAQLEEAKAALRRAEESKAREVSAAQLSLDEASLNLAVVEERRERLLLSRNATPKEEVDRKEALRKRSEAQVQSSKATLEQATADYETNLLAAKASVAKAEAELRQVEIELGYCRMFAPIDGRIGEAFIKVGNYVGATENTELATIEQLNPMGVDLRPSSRYLPRITELLKTGLIIDMIVEGTQPHPFPGKVFFVDNRVDPSTSTVLLKAEVSNPTLELLPGEYVQTRARIGAFKGAIVVPERAVIEGQSGSTVYVVDDQNKVERVRVQAVDTYDGLRVLDPKSLAAGRKVIVDGIQLIRPGMTVVAEPAVPDTVEAATPTMQPSPVGEQAPAAGPTIEPAPIAP